MKSTGPVQLVLALLTISWVSSMPAKESTTRRPSQPQIDDTIKQLTSQLMNSSDITLDTRTPPKVKQQMKKPPRKEETLENSHPGVAVPVEDSDSIFEANTKKFNFYKIENNPTTDRGLSTWVLLNSQTVSPSPSTAKTPRKPTMKAKLDENKNITATDAEIFNKITKPLFKKRPLPTTTRKPTTISMKTSTVADKEYKLTKVKASDLTNAINNKSKTEINALNKKTNETLANSKKENATMQEISTIKPNNKISTTISINDNELIQLEAKDDEIELDTTTPSSKKTRRPNTKRKKTKKQKRPRPSIDKSDTNITALANKVKDNPISTQIYNYLSREIIPTVGVGLVGLMVTAGLASYFLFPFGAARRSYEIVDRKDKEGSYYYSNENTPSGIAEEEVIGKVIAGMPANSNYPNYRSPSSRDAYSNLRYKENNFGFKKAQPESSVEAIYLTPSRKYGDEDNIYVPHRNHKTEFYNPQTNYKEIFEHNQETGYTVEDKQFVVGSVPKEMQEMTPAVVPEHGPRNLPETTTKESSQGLSEIVADYAPRSLPEIFEKKGSHILKVRKRRSGILENEILTDENEIDNRITKIGNKKVEDTTTTKTAETDSTTTVSTNTSYSLINRIKNYLEWQIKIALQTLRSASQAVARYFAEVQRRFNSRTDNTLAKEQPRKR